MSNADVKLSGDILTQSDHKLLKESETALQKPNNIKGKDKLASNKGLIRLVYPLIEYFSFKCSIRNENYQKTLIIICLSYTDI